MCKYMHACKYSRGSREEVIVGRRVLDCEQRAWLAVAFPWPPPWLHGDGTTPGGIVAASEMGWVPLTPAPRTAAHCELWCRHQVCDTTVGMASAGLPPGVSAATLIEHGVALAVAARGSGDQVVVVSLGTSSPRAIPTSPHVRAHVHACLQPHYPRARRASLRDFVRGSARA
jgi:hypothetical protein